MISLVFKYKYLAKQLPFTMDAIEKYLEENLGSEFGEKIELLAIADALKNSSRYF